MSKQIVATVLVAAALFDGTSAFAPAQNNARVVTSLNSESGRRELLGNFAKALGAAGAIAIGADQSAGNGSELLAGLQNPALGSFRGKVSSL